MPVDTVASFIEVLRPHHLLEPKQFAELTDRLQASFNDPRGLARELVRRRWLTPHQVNRILQGRAKDLVLGSYVLMERLGEGGMGEVYKARNWKLAKVVALKLIRKERLANADAVRRFHREIRAAAQLNHPNIVRALDAGEEGGCHFFAMEFVDGMDLAKLVKQRGPLPTTQACDYIRQAALGLQHAFERGLVHRDIKPQNLLLDGSRSSVAVVSATSATDGREKASVGTIKILDMGLALVTHGDSSEDSTTMTKEGAVMGTLDYIAPEQALNAHNADIRSDLYSLGCTLYHLLTGRVPFPGGTATEKLLKHQLNEPEPLQQLRPDVSAEVAYVIRGLLAKRPEERYQTPADAAAALASISSGEFLTAPAIARASAQAGAATAGSPRPQAEVGTCVPQTGPVAAVAEPAGDTVPNWSALVDPSASTADDAPPRQLRAPSKRRWLWINLVGGILLLGLIALLIFLILRSGSKPKPTGESKPPAVAPPAQKDPAAIAFDNWIKKVAALPAHKQVDEVTAKLKERGGEFVGPVKPTIENGIVTGMWFHTDRISDLGPLRALTGLKKLEVGGTSPGKSLLADLSPLKNLRLTYLYIGETRVADLSPLKGMPLTNLGCNNTQVTDLAPLRGMPLTSLQCQGAKVTDLSPLKDLPLRDLMCDYKPERDKAVLSSIKTLERINNVPKAELLK